MRLLVATALVSVFGFAQVQPADAIGCISGGLAGAAAGHLAHHGLLGAVGGCIAGHEVNKHQQMQMDRQRSESDRGYPNQYNSRQ